MFIKQSAGYFYTQVGLVKTGKFNWDSFDTMRHWEYKV